MAFQISGRQGPPGPPGPGFSATGPIADRPPASEMAGRGYITTDAGTQSLWLSDGSAWIGPYPAGGAPLVTRGPIAYRPEAADAPGEFYRVTDGALPGLYFSDGESWEGPYTSYQVALTAILAGGMTSAESLLAGTFTSGLLNSTVLGGDLLSSESLFAGLFENTHTDPGPATANLLAYFDVDTVSDGLLANFVASQGSLSATLSQASSGLRGTVVSGGSGLNGHKLLQFRNSNPASGQRMTFSASLPQPMQVIIVLRWTTTPVASSYDVAFDGTTNGTMLHAADATNGSYIYSGGSTFPKHTGTIDGNGTAAVLTCIWNGSSSVIRVNGVQVATGTCPSTTPGGFSLGAAGNGGRGANIDVAAVALYSTATPASATESFFGSRFGLF